MMMRGTKLYSLSGLVFASSFLAGSALAQEVPNPTSVAAPQGAIVQQGNDIFFYKVSVVRQDIDAVNYLHRSGATHIGFVGTSLLPGARGEAMVKSEKGQITIDAEFHGITPANGFGQEYLTYVLWAISPDGRPQNLGEVLPDGTKDKIHATTSLQSFGLIVTAEPYFSVTTPSDLIVLKNVFTDNTNGVLEHVTAHATLLPRGVYAYETSGANTVSHPITRNERSPLELYEAYNAVRIAQMAGAEKYSPEIYSQANQDLTNAANMDTNKHRDEKLEISLAREAVEKAEDARVDTLRKEAAERQRNTELARDQAQARAAQSQQQAAEAQLQAQQQAAAAQQAALAAQQAQLAKSQADAQAAEARAHELAANQRAADAQARARELREQLRQQLNAVLQTTETPRGLVVNLADVLFDTGKYTLKPNTKISLARVAGIFQSYPGIYVQVEGYTDSTGTDAINQKLSENRAQTTASFLVSQGVPQANVTAAGYGAADPVASNDTAQGRAQNRRVELVVSGPIIGVPTQQGPSAAPAAASPSQQ